MSKYPKTLGRIEAVWNKLGGEDGVDRFLSGETVVQALEGAAKRLLELLTTIAVSAVSCFKASDHFTKDTSAKARVKISWLGDNFKTRFLKKTERDVSAATLTAHRLRESSLDSPIIAELGETHETMLAYLWELLTKQPNGEAGTLLTNGYANIFYIRDTDGILWAVFASWHGVGWNVEAISVEGPSWWRDGRRVFAR